MTDSGPGDTHPKRRLARSEDTDSPTPSELRFEDVYEAHFEFVWRSVRRLGVPASGVDDAVQDVFVVVHRRLADFEGRSSVKTWLFGIALRVARSHRRKAARASALDPLPDDVQGRAEHRPDHLNEAQQAWALVEAFLEELDEDKRAVFVLSELEEHTAPEIAEALGIRTNTVYSRLRAARKQFEATVKRHRAKEERVDT
jgi:RNA polymerase sigma-70 factor (ECF subfamily)